MGNDFCYKIKYSVGDTMEVKEEMIEDDTNFSNRELKLGNCRKYHSKELKMHQGISKPKIQESNMEPEKKYTCEKCARSYKEKRYLTVHRKFGCDVIPQFICKFCKKRFKVKGSMTRHIDLVHHKTNLNTPQVRFYCDKCSRSYAAKFSLTRHNREQHETIRRHYTCDICGYKALEKSHLSSHITSRHLKQINCVH
ncbi:zinc finger protein 717-like [Belonocnema kinseyi]|uniref:zinc finger protein 717-like n=1 Tax=Belonocnema kinseyi TaxID=2817044 RepID=UPI00143D62C6|nr:zinc finger protein 717-like [Belonocnema kinseyi]